MKWVLKAIMQKIFSNVPNGHTLNYLSQKYITKRFPLPDWRLENQINTALQYAKTFTKYSKVSLQDARFYEFGAGWHLPMPLTFSAIGVGNQTIIDVRKNIKVEILDTASKRLPN
jgi:hypothetical protein